MELNDIRIFIELFQSKSVSRTAQNLNYTQSNVSARLMKLEKEFHSVFFVRTKTGLQPLPSAERFMKYAIQIDNQIKDLQEEFNIDNYEIDIASTQLLSRLYFPFLYQNTNVFRLHTSSVKELITGFDNQLFDIIITHTKINAAKEFLQLSRTEELVWVQFENRINSPEKPSLIINRDKDCPLRKASLQTIESYAPDMNVIEVDTLDLMLSLLHSINSIALLPKIMTDKENGLTEFRDFPPEPLTTHIYCSNNKNFLLIRDILHTFC
ncbi:LysR family transcriptional regulator [Anaerocolumna chitinilytica]|uniref:HTH lysR-type domain-containing protein n=1 Tax=Anaerocolumna chitinilytica TaxID=1727145 RepID=A0A7I8DN86_9FIRM|nr:LysR family transcriptional regulator [Anaerocolumna chitinilytica]BCJ98794.1 hypothetical protein bsdcttw_18350 [Anaerocolumna chitinilytica]